MNNKIVKIILLSIGFLSLMGCVASPSPKIYSLSALERPLIDNLSRKSIHLSIGSVNIPENIDQHGY